MEKTISCIKLFVVILFILFLLNINLITERNKLLKGTKNIFKTSVNSIIVVCFTVEYVASVYVVKL